MDAPLPSVWEALVDPSTGQTYYADHKNKVTTWERPKPPPPPPYPGDTVLPHQPNFSENNAAASYDSKDTSTTSETTDVYYVSVEKESKSSFSFATCSDEDVAPVENSIGIVSFASSNDFKTLELHMETQGETPATEDVTAASIPTEDENRDPAPNTWTVEADDSRQETKPVVIYPRTTQKGKAQAKTPFPPYDIDSRPVTTLAYQGESSSSRTSKKLKWREVMGSKIQKRVDKGWKGMQDSMNQKKNDWNSTEALDIRGSTMNEYPLNMAQALWLKQNFRLIVRPETHYWYDANSGFCGKVGGKMKRILDPYLDIRGRLDPRASAGDSGIAINGRDIPETERAEFFAFLGIELNEGCRYSIDGDGYVRIEGSQDILSNWRDQRRKKRTQIGIGAAVATVAVLALGDAGGGSGGGSSGGGYDYRDGRGGFIATASDGTTYFSAPGVGSVAY